MKQEWKLLTGRIIITFVLLMVMELISSLVLPDSSTPLINSNVLKMDVDPKYGFNQIDQLLGWAKTKKKLIAEGFVVESGCVVLSTTEDTARLMHILITGGSTTDISLHANNWPVEFCKILKEHGVKAKIYVAATAGYNTGQELLKLIRDGLTAKPFVHLSYSGANEFYQCAYVSHYEQCFYENAFRQSTSSWLMPNTVLLLRNVLKLNNTEVELRAIDTLPTEEFWANNMRLMHGVAVENNYKFIGMLQPVLGSGKFHQTLPDDTHENEINDYKNSFPEMKKVVPQHPDFLVDLTTMFDTCRGNVFMDNCHINEPYQKVVAINIYETMVERNLFVK